MNEKVAAFGEILLRLSPPGHKRFIQANSFDAIYGGSEANVAVCVNNYGIPTKFITKVPDNEIGQACLQFFRKYGIDLSHVKKDENRLGIYFLEQGVSLRPSKVIYDRAHSSISLTKKGDFNWNSILEGVKWFHWSGITPALSQNLADVTLEAIREANKSAIKVSCDLNYRNLLWKYGKEPKEVMPRLLKECDVLIGNKASVELMLGIKTESIPSDRSSNDNFKILCSKIQSLYPNLEHIFLTQRKSLSANHNIIKAYLFSEDNFHESKEYEITPILDRIGGGDAFVAGIIYGLLNSDFSLQKTLDFGVASSALKLTVKGDINLVSKEEVLKLMKEGKIDHVSR
ncbi:MAG: Sugar kinase [Promethearchaeota archaeon]|nr:MAG: Sugar kinase [Candidatus Lokiarchaeota archaeon]